MNSRYVQLLDDVYDNFVKMFKSASDLYTNTDNKNGLLHPGEFGKYREDACKYFLSNIIPQRYGISDGFLITKDDKISTQCDIIIYDKNSAPIIKNDVGIKFFPIESVVGVGEIKSKLNITTLSESANKLAKNKMLMLKSNYEDRIDLFTFILCEQIENIYKNLQKINNMYIDVDSLYWHNAILSLDDGLFTYKIDENDLKSKKDDIDDNTKIELENLKDNLFYQSKIHGINCLHFFNNDINQRYYNFVSILNNFLKGIEIEYPDPTEYLF